ncbi:VOC family protein [Streptomyces ureilyticus]|uniref:Glyoxalase n=1 Tax=Streptomyces ureilyticus TaxID=1775131 RepID=A0ABX0DXU7_9ACTN|nr:VOC family protein [Streptomyces ureilyticus]NGO46398.1 glyoxalase [Streptomyces ureilyticus]
MTRQPSVFSHVGTTVTDLSRAIEWYQEVLGLYLLRGPLEVIEDGTPLADAAAQIYGVGFQRFQFAHLCGADGLGVELFQFDNPQSTPRENSFEFWRTGINHFALTTRDVDELAEAIANHGGRRRSPTVVIDADKGYSIAYCEDPWGTVIEVCSHPYAQMWA